MMIIKSMPNIKQSLKLAKLYPNIVATTLEDRETGLWSGAFLELDKDSLGDVIYELPSYTYNNSREVIHDLNEILEKVFDNLKTMSN